MNAVTVPLDKLIELQKKAKAVDELRAVNALIMDELTDQVRVIGNLEKQIDDLLYVLEDVNEFLDFAWRDIEMNDYSFTLLEEVICKVQRQIAKANGQSCSTLCHPDEECSITESGKCKAKGE